MPDAHWVFGGMVMRQPTPVGVNTYRPPGNAGLGSGPAGVRTQQLRTALVLSTGWAQMYSKWSAKS
jgi:hypothetical protein